MPYIDFQTAIKILQSVGVQVPQDITDIQSLRAWLDLKERELSEQLTPIMRQLRVTRAVRDLISD